MLNKLKKDYFIYLIIIIGFFLRLYCLDKESFWFDEIRTVYYSDTSLSNSFTRIYNNLQSPLYFFITNIWISILGVSEFKLRLLPVIFGTLSIFLLFKLCKELFNTNTALLASLLLTFSKVNIYFSQEARTYSLMVFLTILSFYFLIKITKNKNFFSIILYIISSILLIYSHYFGLLIIFSQNVFILLRMYLYKVQDIRFHQWFRIQFIILLFFLPWIFVIIHQLQSTASIEKGITENIFLDIYIFIKGYSGSPRLTILFLILLFISLIRHKIPITFYNFKNTIHTKNLSIKNIFNLGWDKLLIILWLVIPIIIPVILSQLLYPLYYNRYVLPSSIAFYILVAVGIDKIKPRIVQALFMIFILYYSIISINQLYKIPEKAQWNKIAQLIDNSNSESNTLIFYPGHLEQAFHYYSNISDYHKILLSKSTTIKSHIINQNIKDYEKLWIIISENKANHKDIIREFIPLNYQKNIEKNFHGGVYVYLYTMNKK